MEFPERYFTHTLERKSFDYFRACLPNDWTINKPDEDYGQDFQVEICEDGRLKGLELIFQLKSSEKSESEGDEEIDYERVTLEIPTYNYLMRNLRVAVIVKYIASENEAYWIKLRDVERPRKIDQKTLTFRIPKANTLSATNWGDIVDYVRRVTDLKLGARDNADF